MMITSKSKRTSVKAAPLIAKPKKDRMPMVISVVLALSGLNSLVLMVLGVSFMILVSGRPMLVQTAAGEMIEARDAEYHYRTPQTIKKFVELNLSLLFTWSGVLPSEQGKAPTQDPGRNITIGSRRARVPTSVTWGQYGLTTENNFRSDMVGQIAKMVPSGLFDGAITQAYEIGSISNPVEIAEGGGQLPGHWKVQVVSTRLLVSKSGNYEVIPFNRELFIRAVHQQEPLDIDGDEAQLMKRLRKFGLEIYAMREMEKHDYK